MLVCPGAHSGCFQLLSLKEIPVCVQMYFKNICVGGLLVKCRVLGADLWVCPAVVPLSDTLIPLVAVRRLNRWIVFRAAKKEIWGEQCLLSKYEVI